MSVVKRLYVLVLPESNCDQLKSSLQNQTGLPPGPSAAFISPFSMEMAQYIAAAFYYD